MMWPVRAVCAKTAVIARLRAEMIPRWRLLDIQLSSTRSKAVAHSQVLPAESEETTASLARAYSMLQSLISLTA